MLFRGLITAMAALTMGSAAAQCLDNRVDNPSFEEIDPADSSLPRGWGIFNTALLRTATDGITPFFARTGNNSIEFPSGADFSGVTTDVLNQSTLEFNNPEYEYLGGDVTVSGWYLIPADQPLDGADSGIKLEFRRANSSIYTSFEDLSISGDTGGQWVEYSFTVTDSDILAVGDFPPDPVAVTVLPLRFGSVSSTGTIFWDDLCLVQATPAPDCPCDVNGDGNCSDSDFFAWVTAFVASPRTPEQEAACDVNGDGNCNDSDFFAWVTEFSGPGCD
ncbi:MAG: dockerin type I domain-containing protein [Planctomycetota bacterium]